SVDLVIVNRTVVHPLHRFRLVQETRHPRTTHEEDSALGCNRNEWLPAFPLLTRWSVGDDDEAWQNVPFEVGDCNLPRAARLLLQVDAHRAPILFGSLSNAPLNFFRRCAKAADVEDIEIATDEDALRPRSKVRILPRMCLGCGEIPVSDRKSALDLQRQLIGIDQLEPFAPEDVALVPRMPVAMFKLATGDGVELRKAPPIFLLVEVRVICELGCDEDTALLLHKEAPIHPFVPWAAWVGCAPHSDRNWGTLEAPEPRKKVGVLCFRELRELVKANVLELRALIAKLVGLGL